MQSPRIALTLTLTHFIHLVHLIRPGVAVTLDREMRRMCKDAAHSFDKTGHLSPHREMRKRIQVLQLAHTRLHTGTPARSARGTGTDTPIDSASQYPNTPLIHDPTSLTLTKIT